MLKKLLFCCLLSTPALLYAQGENNNWTFGKNEGYNFNQGTPPQHLPTIQAGTSFNGGNASVSDAAGNLLFYTSGYGVVDASHNLMPNGELNGGLIPMGILPHGEPGQEGVFILPDIRDTNKYFIFTFVDTVWQTGSGPILPRPTTKLRYSVVDMSLNNGLGDVASNQKDILLAEDVALGMAIVRADDCGFWLVTHTSNQHPTDPNHYLAFKVAENGVETDPVVSAGLLPAYREISMYNVYMQRIKITPDGKKIAAIRGGFYDTLSVQTFYDATGAIISQDSLSEPIITTSTKLEIGDFDATTGMVSGLDILSDSIKRTYHPNSFPPYYDDPTSLEFSGNSQYLYVSQYKRSSDTLGSIWSTFDSTVIYQYDVTLNNVALMKQNKQFVYGNLWRTNYTINNNGLDPTSVRRTPDGEKILMMDFDYATHEDTVNQTLSFTNGINCITDINTTNPGFIEDYITRGDSVAFLWIWPLFGQDLGVNTLSRRDTLFSLVVDTLSCADLTVAVPEGYHSPLWSDGSTADEHTLTAGATYWLQYENDCHVKVDTFKINLNPPPTPIITIDVHTLSTVLAYDSYQWMRNSEIIPGATQSTYTVTENGDYRVIVGNEYNCVDTSEVYQVNNMTGIADATVRGQHISVYPNPAQSVIHVKAGIPVLLKITSVEGRLVQAARKTTAMDIADLAEGVYLLHILDTDGVLLKVEKFIKLK